ncbi:HXXEE domain-containing protein [Intestinibacter sp.]|uniref:HXXEE domain-containing protein n=1 Tax=Intestinibacter sp. TaxID=1965304 RepID=UPI003F152555
MQKIIKGWLSCWLYIITAIGGFLVALLIVNWNVWPMTTKLAVAAVVSLVLHVLEEWKFPGGFYYMYNLQHGASEELSDRYPMSQLTDMLTNFIPIAFGCVMLIFGMPYVVTLMWFGLSAMEVFVHTLAGCQMKRRFDGRGKKTIYNPGLATSYLCFLPIFIGFIISFFIDRVPTILEVLLAIIFTLIMAKICVNWAENTFKCEDSSYPYDWGKGYFTKFCKDE